MSEHDTFRFFLPCGQLWGSPVQLSSDQTVVGDTQLGVVGGELHLGNILHDAQGKRSFGKIQRVNVWQRFMIRVCP
jgi:hypothetical protein